MAAAAKQLTVLITGASRGIGLGLVSTYAAAGYRVIAAARDPATAKALQTVVSANAKSVSTVALDISDSKSVAALPGALAALQPAVESLDVLINNAGVTNAAGSADTSAPRGLGTLESATADDFLAVYRTNVVGTWDVTQKLLPLLRKAAAPKVVNVSSTMGSVASTNAGPIPGLAIAYRASKSALNQLSAVQAREYNLKAVTDAAAAKTEPKGLITVVSLCPGWVDTDLGRGGGKPPLTVEQSTTGILKVITGLKASATAAFVNYAGETVAW